MKKINRKLLLIVLGIIIIGIGVSIECMDVGGQYKRLNSKKTNVLLIRSSVQKFKEIHGRWPVSLAEVVDYAKEYPESNMPCNVPKERISSRNGNSSEHSTLNDQGGWYYNKDTGEVRINLTKPLKEYLYFYLGPDKDEIPSEW